MQRIPTTYGAEWAQGTLTSSQLDFATYVSDDAHPALVPTRIVSTWTTETGAQAVGVTQPAAGGLPIVTPSNTQGAGAAAWAPLGSGSSPLGYTAQAGDQLAFSTTAFQVIVALAGLLEAGAGVGAGEGLTPNAIRNGAVAVVLVDGLPVATLDTFRATPQATVYLDGNAHTVAIQHTGGYNAGAQPIGPVTAGTGTTVAAMLQPTALYHPTFVAAMWRVTAQTATTYSLETQPQGSGSWTMLWGPGGTQGAALTTGTHYSGATYIPGVDLYVSPSVALSATHSATVTTDLVMLVVESIRFGTGTGGGVSTWTSPVYDFGDPATQMLATEWIESAGLGGVTAASGPTATPGDGTWTALSATLGGCVTGDNTAWGTAGLMALPPNQYGQLTLQFIGVSTVPPWVRDLVLYATNPATDPVLTRIPLGAGVVIGPTMLAYVGGLATWYADTRQDMLDLRAAGSIGGAVDAYLHGYLADLGLQQVTGEQPAAARARAQAVLSTAGGALSLTQICQQGAILVTGSGGTPTLSGALGAQTATLGGVLVTQQAGQAYRVTIPAAPYAGLTSLPVGPSTLAGTANNIIKTHITTTLRPVGAAPTVVFTTSS